MTVRNTMSPSELTADESRIDSEETGLGLSPTMAALKRARNHYGLKIGFGILLVMAVFALFAPWLAPHDPYLQNLPMRMLPPVWVEGGSWEYLLGTDHLGRDYLSRII